MDLTEIGVRILFFPAVLIVSILILGIILFVVVNIISLALRIPVAIFNRSLKETEEKEEERIKRKLETPKQKFTLKELWFKFEKGDWIIWVAALPAALIVFASLLQLVEVLSR